MANFFKAVVVIFEEPVIDTLKAIPFLLLVYLLVSYFEHNSHKYTNFFKKAKILALLLVGLLVPFLNADFLLQWLTYITIKI